MTNGDSEGFVGDTVIVKGAGPPDDCMPDSDGVAIPPEEPPVGEVADAADAYPEPEPELLLWPVGLSVIVTAAGEELPGDTVGALGDGLGVYVIVRTIPEDEPVPGAVYVNTMTEGDWLLDAAEPPAEGPLGEPVALPAGLVVIDVDCPSLLWPAEA